MTKLLDEAIERLRRLPAPLQDSAARASGNPNRDVADYISTMTAQLAQMAASEHYTTLAHVLEMTWLESEQLCGRDTVMPPRSVNG
jgi:hypothetical protein